MIFNLKLNSSPFSLLVVHTPWIKVKEAVVSNQLKVLLKPCSSSTCPALYQDAQGHVFIQGSKLSQSARTDIAVADHEEVVQISEDLLTFLRSRQI